MFCPSCGNEIEINQQFCPNCGVEMINTPQKLEQSKMLPSTYPTTSYKSPILKKKARAVIAIIIFLGVGIFIVAMMSLMPMMWGFF